MISGPLGRLKTPFRMMTYLLVGVDSTTNSLRLLNVVTDEENPHKVPCLRMMLVTKVTMATMIAVADATNACCIIIFIIFIIRFVCELIRRLL